MSADAHQEHQDRHRPAVHLNLETTLEKQFPDWFSGRRDKLARPITRGMSRWLGMDVANQILRDYNHLQGLSFIEAVLRQFDFRYLVDDIEVAQIPPRGRVIIAANHPLGGLDSFVLLKLIGDIRPDVKILANDILLGIEPIKELLLGVRIMGGKPSASTYRNIIEALEKDQAVIVFTAGEVSRLGPRGIRDRQWETGFLRFAAHTGAPVLPVHLKAYNSPWFYVIAMLARPLGTLMLPRQLFRRKQHTRMPIRIGTPICAPEHSSREALRKHSRTIRNKVYSLNKKRQRDATMQTIPRAENPRLLHAELQQCEHIGQTQDGKAIYLARPDTGSVLMREIGRLREYTFRAVGEGTGQLRDLDGYDRYYEHLVLWDDDNLEIAGAYRMVRTAPLVRDHGLSALYTAELFNYSPAMQTYLQHGLELGRSFVQPHYWGSRSLDYLWHGIGAYLRKYPEVRYLLGPVTISAQEPAAARDWLVAYYDRFFGSEQTLAEARQPFSFNGVAPSFEGLDADTSFQILKHNLRQMGSRIPTLYKQYTELCEPGGARFLAFGVDPDFNNGVDGLILLDLHRLLPNKKSRYILGELKNPLEQKQADKSGA